MTRGFIVTEEFLRQRVGSGIVGVSKWIQFCRFMLKRGYKVTLYEAQQTVSKYVTVHHLDKTYTVRFSNHKPNKYRELNGDCDMFVGITHTGARTVNDAIRVCLRRMEGEIRGNGRSQAGALAEEAQDKMGEEDTGRVVGSQALPSEWASFRDRAEASYWSSEEETMDRDPRIEGVGI